MHRGPVITEGTYLSYSHRRSTDPRPIPECEDDENRTGLLDLMAQAGARIDRELGTAERLANLTRSDFMPAYLGPATCPEATDDALRVHIWPNGLKGDGDYWTWLPRSVVDLDESDVTDKNTEGELFVRTWFADQEGLPYT